MRRRRDIKFPENGFEQFGGYMQAKIAKLEEQYNLQSTTEDNKLSDIFSGISIFVNGLTRPSADELKILMSQHGGVYHHYHRTGVDYVIASNLPDTKVKRLTNQKIVKPEWITESITAGRLLNYEDYLLYTKRTRTQPKIDFGKANISCKKEETDVVSPTKVAKIVRTDDQSNISIKNESKITRTAVNPNFLGEFYNNSRLHHISQLGAGFKQYVNDLRETREHEFPLRIKLKENIKTMSKASTFNDDSAIPGQSDKSIMHIDMDCFFVSVGLRSHPELRGKPVAVTHSKNTSAKNIPNKKEASKKAEFRLYQKRALKKVQQPSEDTATTDDSSDGEDGPIGSMSEIASSSYEARALGLKNGMFMGAALKLCPDLKTIPYEFDAYKSVAFTLYDTVAQYTLDIEAVSCDEMYVDCSELLRTLRITPMQFAEAIRNEIKMKTGCPCSTGFGRNRLQARLGTKKAKPDGQFYLREDLVSSFMDDIPLADLPGVGRQTQCKLSSLGYTTCGSLLIASLPTLQKHFGIKTGLQLYQSSRGIDDKPLSFTSIRKSVSVEVNYGIRFQDFQQCETFLKQLCVEMQDRMQKFKVLGRAITLKLMVRSADAPVETAKYMGHGVCDNIAKTSTLNQATNDESVLLREVLEIAKKLKVKPDDMRGIGLQVTKLESLAVKMEKRGALDNYVRRDADPRAAIKLELPETPPKIQLAPVKSPKLTSSKKKNLGLTTRRRGRPPKNLNILTISKDASTGIMNKFLKKNNEEEECIDDLNLTGIDKDFLLALPKDIQDEVVKDHRRSKQYRNNKKSVNHKEATTAADIKQNQVQNTQIDKDFLAALPEDLRAEIESEYKIKREENILVQKVDTQLEITETHSIFNMHWKQIREMMRSWLQYEQTPRDCDVDVMCVYMQNLVINRDISNLSYLLRFLYRNIRLLSRCEWHRVYNKIFNVVQESMMSTFQGKLFLPDSFSCCC